MATCSISCRSSRTAAWRHYHRPALRIRRAKYSSTKDKNPSPDFEGDTKDQRSWTHWMAEWLTEARRVCAPGAPICFDALPEKDPEHFAVRQYRKYKLAAGKTAKSILISCGARLAAFDIAELRELFSFFRISYPAITMGP